MRLHTEQLGRADHEPVVFLPGFTGSHRMWGRPFRALCHQYHLILMDTLGFGQSPKPRIAYTLDDHLTAIHTTLQAAAQRPMHLVGYSMGTLLALAYAQHYPEQVASISLIALTCFRDGHEARVTIAQASLFNRLLAMDTDLARATCELMCRFRPFFTLIAPSLARGIPAVVARDALQHNWISYSRTMQHVIFEAMPIPWLRNIAHPTLVIQGVNDRIAPFANVVAAIKGCQNIRLLPIAADHQVVFTHSAAVAAGLTSFLTTVSSPIDNDRKQ
jgi:pimeloyl-ACP methyl ester carboxylesterase